MLDTLALEQIKLVTLTSSSASISQVATMTPAQTIKPFKNKPTMEQKNPKIAGNTSTINPPFIIIGQ